MCQAEEIDLYVMAGQSNMFGIVQMPDLSADLAAPQNIPFKFSLQYVPTRNFYSAGFVDLQPLNNFTNSDGSPQYFLSTFASELTFGQTLQQRSPNKVAILKVAANGTNLAVDWNPATSTSLYHRLVNTTAEAVAELSALGYQPEVKGLVWVQGEADAEKQAYVQSYGTNLGAFFDSLRTEIWFPQGVPIIVNQLHSLESGQFAGTVRTAQAATVAARNDHVYLLNSDDQTLYDDRVHFTGPMQLEVGRRLANFFYPATVPEPSSLQGASQH